MPIISALALRSDSDGSITGTITCIGVGQLSATLTRLEIGELGHKYLEREIRRRLHDALPWYVHEVIGYHYEA